MVTRPPALRRGDLVELFSPSAPVAAECPRRLARGVQALETMGYRVRVPPEVTACHGHLAGSPQARAEALNRALRDPEVRAIVSTIGGHNTNQLVEFVDYGALAADPKILLGYSDFSSLLVAAWQETGVVTFLGPAVLPQFGEHGGLHAWTAARAREVLSTPTAAGRLLASSISIHEPLAWERDDVRPRAHVPCPGPRALREGTARGPVVAANLGTMLALAGTRHFPALDGVILCIEEDEVESAATVDRMLTQLRLMGVLGRIAGLALGRFHPDVRFTEDLPLADIVLQAARGTSMPIALDFDFGYIDPMWTLPLGVDAELACTEGGAGLSLLDAAVR
jgi:muramoyltetrapeptide carboxypeptidase